MCDDELGDLLDVVTKQEEATRRALIQESEDDSSDEGLTAPERDQIGASDRAYRNPAVEVRRSWCKKKTLTTIRNSRGCLMLGSQNSAMLLSCPGTLGSQQKDVAFHPRHN
jgi:hypothetical protein